MRPQSIVLRLLDHLSAAVEGGMLRRVWERWKVIAHKIGIFQSRLLLNIFYFSILLPFGVGIKLFSDRLQLKPHQGPYWLGKASGSADWEQVKRQF